MNKKLKGLLLGLLIFSTGSQAKTDVSSGLATWLQANVTNFKNLDYNSTQLSIPLPKGMELVFDWGFAGSGNVFSPLPSVKAKLIKADNQAVVPKSDLSVVTAANILAKDQIRKVANKGLHTYKDSPVVNKLLKEELDPFDLFVVKLVLLMKTSDSKLDLKMEMARLLFRLSQNKLFKSTGQPLSSYLPTDIKAFMEEESISRDWLDFIDTMWRGIASGFAEYKFDKDGKYDASKVGREAFGYVFDDGKLAGDCFGELTQKQIHSCDAFKKVMSRVVPQEFEVFDDFEQYLSFVDLMKSKKTSIEYQFIGYKDFGRLTYDSQSSTEYQDYLPEAVKDKVLSDKTISKDSSSNVILVEVNENQYWVVYVSERLDLVQTCKLLLITLMRSLEEYKAIKALEPEVKQEVVVKSENIQDEQQLSDQIQELENELNKLKFSEKLLIKSRAKSGKLNQCKKAIDILEEKLKLAKETVNQVVLKAEDQKTGLAKNLFQRFINMPEIKGMLAEINNGSGECEGVKANLLKRMEHVLINSEWVEDNLPICEYLVTSLFPDLRSVFDVKHKEPQHETVAGQFLAGLLA